MFRLVRTVSQYAATLFVLTLAFLPQTALAQSDAEQAFEASGLESLFAKAPEVALEVAQQLGAEENVTSAWETSVRAHLAPDSLTAALRLQFADRLDPESLGAIMRFRRTELGQAITAAEAEGNSSLDEASLEEMDALSEDRRALYAKLGELTAPRDGSGQFLRLVEAFLEPLLPKADLDAAMTELAGIVEETASVNSDIERALLTFGPFSDADLKAYIDHLESPEGQVFLHAKSSSEDIVFRNAVEALATDFASRIDGQ